jgi:uncharacterized protein
VRQAVLDWIDAQQPATAINRLRLHVLRSAIAADIVLDLHCDDDSLSHIFTSPELMPGLSDLAGHMDVAAVLTAEDSGGGSFDEMLPSLFRKLRAAYPSKTFAPGPEAATLEYRGAADVSDALGARDAQGLFDFFVGRGQIAGTPVSPPAGPAATPFEATEVLRVDRPGLLSYRVELGDPVRKGQPIADIISMDGPEAFLARTPVLAGTDGFVLSRISARFVAAGMGIAKIVGTQVLASRAGGYLLED